MENRKAAGSSKKTAKRKSKGKNTPKNSSFFVFLSSRRMIQVYGIVLLAFSLLLAVATISYIINYKSDLSCVTSGTKPGNLAGIAGAYIAHFFVENSFGIFSIGFALLFFLTGFRLSFGRHLMPIIRTFITTLLSMAWLSLASAFVGRFFFGNDLNFLGGSFGNFTTDYLHSHVGSPASVLIILVFLAAILILCYNLSIHTLFRIKKGETETVGREKPERHKKLKYDECDDEDMPYTASSATDLPDLYITTRNQLTDEYDKNKIYFKVDDTLPPEKSEEQELHQPASNLTFEDIKSGAKTTAASLVEPDIVSTPGNEVSFVINETSIIIPDACEQQDNPDLLSNGDDSFDLPDMDDTDISQSIDPAMLEEYDPRKDLSHYAFPPLDLLAEHNTSEINKELLRKELIENKEKIERTLKNFGIPITHITATIGPTVTLYEIIPAEGVRISKIKNLEDDIALSLAALGIRIIAPIPGKGTIGIEVPNKNPNIVSMRDIIASEKFQNNKYDLPVGLGKTISNEPFVVDLAKMPHLLMAGATGQGKSVGLNAIITSLLYKKHPAELKLVLVDPKKVEFTLYSIIERHYLAQLPDSLEPIITDTKKVVATLNSLCIEMDTRYDLLKLAKVRNIKEYNAKFCARKLSPANGHHYMPYIVLIIDEFGDLIMTAGREIETPIARLAQLARAIGIHLIIATQRPSVNIITGIIKANFPSRVAFRVSSKIDSRTILDGSGADQLIGKGDMLISTGSDLIRLQCAFVDTPEVEEVAKHIENQQGYPEPFLLPEYVPEEGKGDDGASISSDEIDSMFMEAATLILQTQLGSTSLIQRKMKLGYNRAGRIMDQLEEFGVVGPSQGSKAREVKVRSNDELTAIFQRMGLL
ncbi:MAG: DNA translocase FtsK [Bacteroidales bacterium]|jgi:S-DNA-T family DNA segregation ATPase FtsK/SpoIIIE|nr:DNA translocase FtsK [Bacteroidales bacterium]